MSSLFIVTNLSSGKLQVVSSLVIEGPVYALELLQNSRKLVAVAFSTVFVFNWKNNSLSNDVTHEGCILGLFLRTTGDFILVGTPSYCIIRTQQLKPIIVPLFSTCTALMVGWRFDEVIYAVTI